MNLQRIFGNPIDNRLWNNNFRERKERDDLKFSCWSLFLASLRSYCVHSNHVATQILSPDYNDVCDQIRYRQAKQ